MSVYCFSSSAISLRINEVVRVIHVRKPHMNYEIDGLASRVWESLDGVTPLNEIIDKIAAAESLTAPATKLFRAHTHDFAKELLNEDLLETVD